MSSSTLSLRVSPAVKKRLKDAADASDQTLTEFLISAGEQRADEVLAARTVVPPDFYDELIAALDEGPQADPVVQAIFSEPRHFEQR